MKKMLIEVGKFALKNKGEVMSKVKDEVVDTATSTAKNFVWRYLIVTNLAFGIGGFILGSIITYVLK